MRLIFCADQKRACSTSSYPCRSFLGNIQVNVYITQLSNVSVYVDINVMIKENELKNIELLCNHIFHMSLR